MSRVIHISNGATEYVSVTFTEATGKTIFADSVWISLGSATAPGQWLSATTLAGSGSTITAGVLVDSATPLGIYTVWGKIGDSPETVIRPADGTVTLV